MSSTLGEVLKKTWLTLESAVATFRARIVNIDNYDWGIVDINWKQPIEPQSLKEYVEFVAKTVVAFVLPHTTRLIISSRAPIWFYCAFTHSLAHELDVLATYDPKVQGAVVVVSHVRDYAVGNVVELPPELLAEITQVKV
ncbi:MAG: hypothetical protein DRJ40_11030 [Thermoprotei archaeon]|nr:MAG: hypothetical protein DRJ40_11030 [Thermoprotei archaeon]